MTIVRTGLASTTPVSFAPTPGGKVYGVNGLTRGFVVVGHTTAYPIGVTAAPAVVASSATSPQYYYVDSVDVIAGGENYHTTPSVTIAGVTGARAVLVGDAVGNITIVGSATTHTYAPPVLIDTAAQASNAAATAVLRGSVIAVHLKGGTQYTSSQAVTFTAAAGVTVVREAQARSVLRFARATASSGPATSVIIEDPGVYEWDSTALTTNENPLSASAAGGMTLTPVVSGAVASVVISTGGSRYTSPPNVSFLPRGPLREGGGAAAVASLLGSSSVSDIDVVSGGNGYSGRVDVRLASDRAKAVTVLAPRLAGKYLLGWRYVSSDGTPGDLCPLVTLDCGEKASSIAWDLSSVPMTDGSPSRVSRLELWRTSSDQAITLYRVASLTVAQRSALSPSYLFTEGLTDAMLTDIERDTTISGVESKYQEMPILTENGLANAYRFGIPPSTMSVVTLFGDRAWYAVDSSGAEPNTIYFSGVQEYDSVPAENQLVLQSAGRETDAIRGLIVIAGSLYAGQRRALTRITVGDNPLLSASATLAAQRGLLNDRCHDQLDGITYIADYDGIYAFDGNSTDPLSDPVATYWTDSIVDFSKSAFFFVRADAAERVVRFYFSATSQSGDYPKSALCLSLITKAWWLEEYAVAVSCGVRVFSGNRQAELVGSTDKLLRTGSGLTDLGASIPYTLRTGNMPLSNDKERSIRLLYTPTSGSVTLNARLYYNGSATPRTFPVATDRGSGFVTATGSTQATLNLDAARSPLGTATGVASLSLSGRLDDKSAGADRHVAVEFAGEQATSKVILHTAQLGTP